MFFDHIDSVTARTLESRFPALRKAFAWIRAMPPTPADGITELRGPAMYVNVHGYATLPADQCRWESHHHTIDVQFCIGGGEQIDWLPDGTLAPMNNYDAEKDTEHWRSAEATSPTRLRMFPRAFVVFLPGELHLPKIADGSHPEVRKLVVKIQAHLLEN